MKWKKNLPTAQETSTSLGPFFAFLVVQCWICCLHLSFFSHTRCVPLLLLLCHVVVCPHPCPCHRPMVVVLLLICLCPLVPIIVIVVCPLVVGVGIVLSHCFCHCGSPSFSSLSPSSPCQLFPPHEQLLALMGCWWPLVSLPRHSLSLPHFPCHQTSPHFVVVLIHHPPHEQVLIVMELLWVCHLGIVWW